MSLLGAALEIAVSSAQGVNARARASQDLAASAENPSNLIGGIGFGPAGYSPLTGQKTAIRQRMEAAQIDVATPVSITPGAAVQGEQQQLYNYVNKPMLQQTTPAQIAQAEPTRMVMTARQQAPGYKQRRARQIRRETVVRRNVKPRRQLIKRTKPVLKRRRR